MSDKPHDFISSLGPKVELSSEALPSNKFLKERLRDMGETLCGKQVAAGQKYVGSFAVHIVMDTNAMLKTEYSIGTITQIALDEDLSENVVSLAMNNTVIQLRKWFNPKFKPGRRGDNR